jgi:hypothetical protein
MSKKSSKEAYAYTPGLKIKKLMALRNRRILPILGEVLVEEGDVVDFDTIVAKTMALGDPYIFEAANLLGLEPNELPQYMVKKTGDSVEKDEIVAQYIAFWGLIKRFVRSPIDGVIESFSPLSGRITAREHPTPIEIKAYVPGKVVEVIPNEGVVIETNATYIQGIFGIGGERHGQLEVVVDSPDEILKEQIITPEHKGKIIVGGSFVALGAMRKAIENGVTGIVVGGINADDLNNFLGYRIGVAITGEEEIGTTVIVTEGFGEMRMSHRTFEYLKSSEGQEVAINGATQIRAGVLRPEVIIPNPGLMDMVSEISELGGGMKPGTPIRVIREPYFGKLGAVVSLPVELQRAETESLVRMVEVQLDDGGRVMVPRANVEIIEE